jgi:hypothetical protein
MEHDLFGKPASTFPHHALAHYKTYRERGKTANGFLILIGGRRVMIEHGD